MTRDLNQLSMMLVETNDDSSSVVSMTQVSKETSTSTCRTNPDDIKIEVDDRGVTLSRWLVTFVLVSATCSLCLFTYRYVLHNQEEDFENEFTALSNEIIELSQAKVQNLFGVLEGLSVSTTSYALSTNAIWPFVTIPNFEQLSAAAKKSSQALIIAHVPLVEEKDRYMWEQYSTKRQGWIQESYSDHDDSVSTAEEDSTFQPIPDQIWYPGGRRRHLDEAVGCVEERNDDDDDDDGNNRVLAESKSWVPEDRGTGPYAPVWHLSPPPPMNDTQTINYNLLRKPVFKKAVQFVSHSRRPVFLDVCNQAKWFGISSMGDKLQTVIVQPIFKDFTETSKVVGYFVAVVPWESFFSRILHPQAKPITVVLQNTCDEVFTFQVEGYNATLVAEEIAYDKKFEYMDVTKPFAEFSNPSEALLEGYDGERVCVYNISVYPTQSGYDVHVDSDKYLYAGLVASIFILTSFVFYVYDLLVQKRQMRLIKNASELQRSLITSLFPANVRDRVIQAARANQDTQKMGNKIKNTSTPKSNWLSNMCDHRFDLDDTFASKPIADLFPEVTIMFADIAGFTAWSSARAPEQVFTLLETIYQSFDAFAGRMKVFKVETIGDCYVAATGIPEYDKHHAINMATFARWCLKKFNQTVHILETTLGPETRELKLRTGLHTGPITAGVLRGEKARFQLFGDTMNTASRMESTGEPNKIHISREIADLIIDSGKKEWVSPREDIVHAKGKGAMKTFWLNTGKAPVCASTDTIPSLQLSEMDTDHEALSCCDGKIHKDTPNYEAVLSEKVLALIDWNCALLLPHLQDIVVRRKAAKPPTCSAERMSSLETHFASKTMVAEEVQDIIELPEYIGSGKKSRETKDQADPISEEVKIQLYSYVKMLASMYEDNPFHCFERASYVTMSTAKFLSRIVAPTTKGSNLNGGRFLMNDDKTLHDHTHDITPDPLTQFAVILAALMHDTDHKSAPNGVLIQENPTLSERFQHKSVAEQTSVDLAWNLLMGDEFEALRRCIYCNEVELKCFRQLIVNSMMATDVFDKSLSIIRKERWDKAFSADEDLSRDDADVSAVIQTSVNRKATLVIEHLIQASYVAHTMQHWILYKKWNERLFEETYEAYLLGRVAEDPSEGWYDGEIWFFDNYIIPLAKKLNLCGVLGASSDESLNYAIANRREWEVKGKEIVAEMKTKYCNI